eukprot:evm.model.scf_2651.1 EVM.evm.TU.scf_2651.1   scf_2651:3474-9936(-)
MAISEEQSDLLEKTVSQVQKDFMPGQQAHNSGDPQSVHAFFPPAFAGFWAILREAAVADSRFTRAEKEQIAAFVSVSNECKFCTAAHTNFAIAAGADGDAVREAIAAGNPELLATARMRKICSWAKDAQEKRSSVLNERPFMNMVFGKVGNHIKGAGPVKQGESLAIVSQDAELPAAFRWTKGNASIAKAFAYWNWAMDELAKKYIPKEVTDFVGDYIEQNYTGQDPPISRKWVFNVAEETGLSEANQSAVRYMLLMSFARFQIDGSITGDLAKHFPDEHTQLAIGMWAAHQTAKEISKWGGEAALKHLEAQ